MNGEDIVSLVVRFQNQEAVLCGGGVRKKIKFWMYE